MKIKENVNKIRRVMKTYICLQLPGMIDTQTSCLNNQGDFFEDTEP